MGYSIAICDDDSAMAENIKASLEEEFSKAGRTDLTVDYYPSGNDLLSSINYKYYKAVLLDINMEPMSGFSVAEKLGKSGYRTKIVFITSYDDIVYDTFDYTPFYFIRKSRYEVYLRRLVKKLISIDSYEKELNLEVPEGVVDINTSEIMYVESQDHYLDLFTADNKLLTVRKKMTEFEQMIKATDLVRAHKKYIINYKYIKSINHGKRQVLMSDGKLLKLGRTYKENFVNGYLDYKHQRETND